MGVLKGLNGRRLNGVLLGRMLNGQIQSSIPSIEIGAPPRFGKKMAPYAAVVGVVAGVTGICHVLYGIFAPANLIMIYLFGVGVLSLKYGRRAGIAASILSTLAFDLICTEPRGVISPSDGQYVLAMVIMLAIAFVISGLVQQSARLARESYEAQLRVERNKIRNALIRSISHDLKTPLAAIAGAAHAFSTGQGDSREMARTIYEESVRLNLQVQKVLDMTRLQSEEVVVDHEWHCVEELLEGPLRTVANLAGSRRISTHIPDDFPMLWVDGELVGKVFLNLVENALTHTGDGVPIEIDAGSTDAIAWVAVSDRGDGIAPGDLDRIFEPAVRAGGGGAADGGFGSGMGLAICRAIMALHGGTISARNRRDGPGAEFRLEFPRRGNEPGVLHD